MKWEVRPPRICEGFLFIVCRLLKNRHKNMENVRIKFYGIKGTDSRNTSFEACADSNKELRLEIEEPGFPTVYMYIDKPTAVRLVRELKRQISFLTEDHED